MQLPEVGAALERSGLEAIKDRVLARCRPCAWLILGEPGEGPTGGSRVGGRPDAPPGTEWPLSPEGKPLAFVMQVALSDPALPLAGLLSVFMDEFAGGFALPHRLWLTPPGASLRPLAPPSAVENDLFGNLQPHGLALHAGLDVPRWDTNDYAAVVDGLTEDEQNAYNEDFTWALEPIGQARTIGKLFGHVAGIGSDPREDAVVWDEAPDRMYDGAFTRDIRRASREGARERQWTNLLMIDSCQAIDLCIGDSGYLQLMIKDAMLAHGDLSQTYGQLESS